ncbi:unnamed protein product [Darwinula stevensoni]|uniref:Otopetrin-2 n=1 Tax=Darwinula stevensoni TaxID=69355 RepID=A0A7R8X3K9_9CRUS|nr:unnamed protein product [Darwinula stevensoni]CAG0882653.1 unnamed protein product [Darwinula stevensoni]
MSGLVVSNLRMSSPQWTKGKHKKRVVLDLNVQDSPTPSISRRRSIVDVVRKLNDCFPARFVCRDQEQQNGGWEGWLAGFCPSKQGIGRARVVRWVGGSPVRRASKMLSNEIPGGLAEEKEDSLNLEEGPPITMTVSTTASDPVDTTNGHPSALSSSSLQMREVDEKQEKRWNAIYPGQSFDENRGIPNDNIPLSRIRRDSTNSACKTEEKAEISGNNVDGMFQMISAMYGKLLVVMGLAFPLSEIISSRIPDAFYEGFYLYLYIGSILFLGYVYIFLLSTKRLSSLGLRMRHQNTEANLTSNFSSFCSNYSADESLTDVVRTSQSYSQARSKRLYLLQDAKIHFGSFYLRLGVLAFGVGNMIYSGLEFTQLFEHKPSYCSKKIIAITSGVHVVFTFLQMYFVFLNSKMLIPKYKKLANFGLMHMIATNLCVWLHVLVEESKHEFLEIYHELGLHNASSPYHHRQKHPSLADGIAAAVTGGRVLDNETQLYQNETQPYPSYMHHIHRRALRNFMKGMYDNYECSRSDIMGEVVQNASPFLFPCVIEYSLICAAILYVMWIDVGVPTSSKKKHTGMLRYSTKRSRHHYSMDCAGANRGLFMGLIILVLTVISLILFFVLISRDKTKELAVIMANVSELVLYVTTAVASVIGLIMMRNMSVVNHRLQIDSLLLIIAQTGLFMYSVFIIIGGYFMMNEKDDSSFLTLITGLMSLIQGMVQTIFILDASRRVATCSSQARRKPGREFVTFLIVSNLAMWAINTLETSRANVHPIHLRFYGQWAWTIIIHVSMPLAIFYRFHSTVCLCEVWTKAYKIRAIKV